MAYLMLANRMIFEGEFFGAKGDISGEVVFTTGMTGYLETLTDQNYHGQIVLQTFPLIGNYGVIPSDFEHKSIAPAAYIVKHPCQEPSNFRSEGDLGTFLYKKGIVGLCGIDTRMLTKTIRSYGVMNGRIKVDKPTEEDFAELQGSTVKNPVAQVSVKEKALYKSSGSKYTVALIDLGAKESIKRGLLERDCDVWVLPHKTGAEEIRGLKADGIILSNGPGDPADNTETIANIKVLIEARIPMFGICLGHQMLALANGFQTAKLKYGHRGANQPVKDTQTGRVYISTQNHGYEVISSSINREIAEESFINVNDKTNEGIMYKNVPAFSAQFHPEASGESINTGFLFDRFIKLMEVR